MLKSWPNCRKQYFLLLAAKKNLTFACVSKKSITFAPVIRQEKELMKSFNFAYYFFFYFYFSHKVEREFVCVK